MQLFVQVPEQLPLPHVCPLHESDSQVPPQVAPLQVLSLPQSVKCPRRPAITFPALTPVSRVFGARSRKDAFAIAPLWREDELVEDLGILARCRAQTGHRHP